MTVYMNKDAARGDVWIRLGPNTWISVYSGDVYFHRRAPDVWETDAGWNSYMWERVL